MNILIVAIGILFVYFFWRKRSHQFLETDFKLNVYALRDELRMLAVNGKINQNSWIFDHFDNSMSKMACNSYYISLPYLIFISIKNEKYRKQINAFSKVFDAELKKNPELIPIMKKLNETIKDYVHQQHKYSVSDICIWIYRKSVELKIGASKSLIKTMDMVKKTEQQLILIPQTSVAHYTSK